MRGILPNESSGLTRGEFLKTAFLSGLFASGAMRPFRAAAGVFSSGKPELTLGILTDIHVSIRKNGEGWRFEGEDVLRRAFEHFRDNGADGVAICGDMANYGLIEELNAVSRCWYSVFPDDKAPDGRHVEKLFVYGNHDWEGYKYGNMAAKLFGEAGYDHSIRKDIAAAWREAFHEEFAPVWRKEVKGYTFVGAHWIADRCRAKDEVGVPQAAPWFKENGQTLDPTRPFFYLQHPPLKGTCHGAWVWGHDTGEMTKVLSKYPNAIALSGHSHASISDERAIWQGAFTSIGCGSLKYTGLEYGDVEPHGRENDLPVIASQRGEDAYKILRKMRTGDGHQGMIARVYPDRIVYARMDFESMAPLGDDWVMPLPAAKPMPLAFATRAPKSVAPEFPAGAALAVRMGRGRNRGGKDVKSVDQAALEIVIPPANRPGAGRTFDYRVTIAGSNGVRDERFVFAEGFYRAAASDRAKAPTVCSLAIGRLKAAGELKIEVYPRNSFGVEGRALSARFSLSDVPDAFVEYVESSGVQYVDTGVVGRCNTSAEMAITWLSVKKDGSFLSSRISGDTNTRFILCSNGGSGQYYAGHRTWTTRAEAKCDANGIDRVFCSIAHDGTAMTLQQTVNGKTSQSETRNEEAIDTKLNMYLFAQNCGGSPALGASVRCYGVKIWQDGELVRDYRPCVKNGAACLYDRASRKIVYPLGGALSAPARV